MKLAQALVERRAARDRLEQLQRRLGRAVVVQEGDTPLEDPAALLQELNDLAKRLEHLIVAVNRTNSLTYLADGRRISAAIAHRDVLKIQQTIFEHMLNSSTINQHRLRNSEIRMVNTVSVPELQRQYDALAKDWRETDTLIQEANWSVELIESEQ
jgi:hypothetical protein